MNQNRNLWLKISVVVVILALISVGSVVSLTATKAEAGDTPKVTVQWASISPMPKPRHAGATVVVDGIIYTIGGAETGGSYKYHPPNAPEGYVTEVPMETTGIRVEAYDPASNQWTIKADLPYPPDVEANEAEGRMYLAAAAYNGKIYTFGGADMQGVVKDTVDVYDIASDIWTAGIATLPEPAVGMSAVTYGDKIYLFGGSASTDGFAAEDFYRACYGFNPATAEFTAIADMIPSRTRTSAAVFEDQIMVFGGSSAWGNRNAQMYNPATDSWSFREVVVVERGYWFGIVANDMVFLMGGRDEEKTTCTEVDVYSEEWQAWVTATNMPAPHEDAFVAAVDGELYIMGGGDNKGKPDAEPTPLNSAVRGTIPSAPPTLDLTTTPEEVEVTIQWLYVAPMPTPRCQGATAVVDNIIYTIGGMEGESETGELGKVVEAYDPVADKWTTKASLPEGRFDMAAAAYDGKIYIFGGVDTQLEVVDTVDVYDVASNTWTAGIATLPKPTAGIAATTCGDKIYLFGGSCSPMLFVPSSYYYNNTYVFDPVALTFTASTPMPIARNMAVAGVIEDEIYVIGGVESTGATATQTLSPDNNSWSRSADMPERRGGHTGTMMTGNAYIVGGHGTSDVSQYDPGTDEWSTATPLQMGRNSSYVSCATASPESIYVMGGIDSKGNILGSVEKGTPYEGEPPLVQEPEPEPEPEAEPSPPPGQEQTPPSEGMGCAKSSLVREPFDFSPILLGVVWVGAALALGSLRKRNR